MTEHAPEQPEILERLRSLEGPQGSALAELAYRRAREALEQALEEARRLRLQALEDARTARERESAALTASLQALRQSAQSEVETLLAAAQVEAEQVRARARSEAEDELRKARKEADSIRREAASIVASANERVHELERMESEFNSMLVEVARRVGLGEEPQGGWLRWLSRRERR